MSKAAKAMSPLVLGLLATACASVSGSGDYNRHYNFSSIERTAVVSVEGIGRDEVAQAQVAAMTNQALLGKGYSPIERNQIRKVIEEQELSRSQVTSSAGAAEVGRILNVDTVVLVNIPKYGEEMSMSMQMIDVEDGAILWSASGSADEGAGGKAGAILGAIAGGAAGAAAGDSGGAVLGGAAAGAGAGGLAGEGMTPERQEQSAALIEKLTETLPDRG